MIERWESTVEYTNGFSSATRYDKGTPQIVDINHDGIPEVCVYNKIYNATTGELLISLDNDDNSSTIPFMGVDPNIGTRGERDGYISFNQIYDIDLDGKYDIIAGGCIYYDIDPIAKTYKKLICNGVPDGRTAVADIDGDGIADIVVQNRPSSQPDYYLNFYVWKPGFWEIENEVKVKRDPTQGQLFTNDSFKIGYPGVGSSSYIYIGDVDGKVQNVGGKEYRLPEISIITGLPRNNNHWNYYLSDFPKHPNVSNTTPANGGFPTGSLPTTNLQGGLYSFTLDKIDNKLKLSFFLGHNDTSGNTGFTLFDFDNDGIQEICYRDEKTVRIIKASKPYVAVTENLTNYIAPKSIVFSEIANSYTGFEYPVIADINNDASAEILVTGRIASVSGDYATPANVLAIGSKGDKFAPAMKVWNQFMYDPFKINEDLTIPTHPAPDRLGDNYKFNKIIRDENNKIVDVIYDFSPYNGNIIQMFNYMVSDEVIWDKGNGNIVTVPNAYEPVVFMTEAFIVDENTPIYGADANLLPKTIKVGNQAYAQVTIGNKASAKTAIAANTPIIAYYDQILPTTSGAARKYVKKELRDLGVTSAIEPGTTKTIQIPVDNFYGFYIVRLGDDSENLDSPNPTWRFGKNNIEDAGITYDGVGLATRACRDCDWIDQIVKVSELNLNDDFETMMIYNQTTLHVTLNDEIPTNYSIIDREILSGPLAGTASISSDNIITYINNKPEDMPDDSVDKLKYKLKIRNTNTGDEVYREATVYIYVLQPANKVLGICYGDNYILNFKPGPQNSSLRWYAIDDTNHSTDLNLSGTTITNVTSNIEYWVKPYTPLNMSYNAEVFPALRFRVPLVTSSSGESLTLVWQGDIDDDWDNPFNWKLQESDGSLQAVNYTPTSCIDIIINDSKRHYPVVSTQSADVNSLSLINRAMVKNIHRIDYGKAYFELKLNHDEKNRWVMYAPPFKETMAGDFTIFKNNVVSHSMYLSIYNPSLAKANGCNSNGGFSSTIASSDVHIKQPLMFYAHDINSSTDVEFYFPEPQNQFDRYRKNLENDVINAESNAYQANRANNKIGRFLFDSYISTSNTDLIEMTYSSDADNEYVLIANVFPSYLSVYEFLADPSNSQIFEQEAFIWNGTSDAVKRSSKTDNTWRVNENTAFNPVVSVAQDMLIPPFQAFFVKKKNKTDVSVDVVYRPNVMTSVDTSGEDYKLK